MKTLFDFNVSVTMIDRIQKISPESSRQWGKMDVSQMLAHCGNALDMAMGTTKPKRVFIGRILGPLFKGHYTNEEPFDKSSPTSEEIKVVESRDFNTEKSRLLSLVKKFSEGGEKNATTHPHPFFGLLKPSEWGIGMYKHLDHHLRQFGG
ncbi:hypothetical protein WSM22_16470 [Cytophagales bacterium WSM2-2]|nr:hypothetical protein WSM22_16470 [Cytophagales bacterium WSM2-2]